LLPTDKNQHDKQLAFHFSERTRMKQERDLLFDMFDEKFTLDCKKIAKSASSVIKRARDAV
jgi:hypothetical protein